MPEHCPSPTATAGSDSADETSDSLRIRSRSPHPYRRLPSELLEPSDRLASRASRAAADGGPPRSSPPHSLPSFARESPPVSESGTDADDEHFLRGLPAPKRRLHKGLRGRREQLSGSSTPALSPALLEEEGRRPHWRPSHGEHGLDWRGTAERARRRRELVRRAVEAILLGCQARMVASNADVQPSLRTYRKELFAAGGLFFCLAAAYPLRLIAWAYRQGKPSRLIPIRIPATFDPAPLLYPPLLPVLVSLLCAQGVKGAVLPSLVLSICTCPRQLVPGARYWEPLSCTHWLLSCLPFTLDLLTSSTPSFRPDEFSRETLTLLYPLHQTLCLILHHFTTTSLLVSELQLLSAGLISLLLLASSPQAVILKALLWGGGLGLVVSCSQVIQWGISLARVPKWRFRRAAPLTRGESGLRDLRHFLPFQRPRSGSRASYGSAVSDSDFSADDQFDGPVPANATKVTYADAASDAELVPALPANLGAVQPNFAEPWQRVPARRHTLPAISKSATGVKSTTPSGRRKRAMSSSMRAFVSLTQAQATIRKWLYACHVYICILAVILVGIRAYVQRYALSGYEPIGWALGYLLGDIPQFRLQVVKAGTERWICLPPRGSQPPTCHAGWVQHVRLAWLGAANTRLLLSGYWVAVLAAGLAVVFRLSRVCEVDTRRKVFHFTMVAMLLPAVYLDPCFAALALALALAVFLLLDLLRASQLPPLSRPIARFLAPYVDGRDLRGPVVVSHIFLLIGCAIPLWLSLASLPRRRAAPAGGAAAAGPLAGWEVPTREVGMVSGVVCVGLGDAAASLVGRRWGVRKWLWGGGKSLEGSAAFAAAVFAGLMVAALWLRLGGWEAASGYTGTGSGWDSLASVLDLTRLWPWLSARAPRAAACASLASLTEAVLTGGNDNVIVPVVLWGCVKSLGV
ncbi:uncharacterized protein THITE_2038621 [Thermothielavioides terrestris NRRL 8126]|uniref:dolichol kinase n=1 Tax=Thermothielavioides terrestris (strain ATCC 38088 / NRRL 8126) TaxID=578455 RepID=G2QR78_THETT|nr:uncharacterized protein THITE_2038621 [Thermothielavioides terrestris NRRL 8126]AEO63332.1 hypothetical protein THITE_2038621 [Thermothielavioides terrestris NRRL 8126]